MATESTVTVARPYAKAVFEFALEKGELAKWSTMLEALAIISLDADVVRIIDEPGIETSQVVKLIKSIAGKHLDKFGENFVELLAENKRLTALSEVKAIYESLKSEHEKQLVVDVISFSPLSSAQSKSMVEHLTAKLKREVSLNVSIDSSLIGGAIIRAGDFVIDGSVKGKLEKLKTEIAV